MYTRRPSREEGSSLHSHFQWLQWDASPISYQMGREGWRQSGPGLPSG